MRPGARRAAALALGTVLCADAVHAVDGSFRVKLQGLTPALAQTVGGIPGVTLAATEGPYDLLLTQDDAGFKLFHPSGDEIASYEPAQLA